MKAIRTTTLSCGVLSAQVKVYSATEQETEIKFSLCGPTGEPVEQIYVEREHPDDQEWEMQEGERTDRRTVTTWEYPRLGRSYNGMVVNKNDITKAENDALVDEDENDLSLINVERFVPLKDVPMERAMNLYFIGPDKKLSGKAFETFKAALKKKKVAAIAKVVIKKRQMLLAIYESNGAVVALRLRFAREMRERTESVEDDLIDPRATTVKKEIDMMGALIDEYMVDPSEIDEMEDTYVEAKVKIVEAVLKGEKVEEKAPKAPKKNNSNLMEELEASVKDAKKAKGRKGKVKA